MSFYASSAAGAIAVLTAVCVLGCENESERSAHELRETLQPDAQVADTEPNATDRSAVREANTPAALSAIDLTLDGYPEMADTTAVRAAFGEPDSVFTLNYPGDWFSTWRYSNLSIDLANHAFVVGFGIAGSGAATARGLRVGDSEARVVELYGEPDESVSGWFTYRLNQDSRYSGVLEQGIRVRIKNGVVEFILLGMIAAVG